MIGDGQVTAKKTSLSDALRMEAEVFRKGPICRVRVIAEIMTPADQAMFINALKDPLVPGSHLARALVRMDPKYKVSADALQRHRHKECACT